jgi:hypothetical protein
MIGIMAGAGGSSAAGISFVGSMVNETIDGGNVTLTFTGLLDTAGAGATLAENDVVIVAYAVSGTADAAMSTSSSGWTEEAELYGNDTNDVNLAVYSKRMGASPDADIVLVGNADASAGTGAMAFAFRGVDTTTLLDVAVTTATGIDSGQPNPASITPSTAGALIAVAVAGTAGNGNEFTNPGDLSATTNHFRSVWVPETIDIMLGMGIKTDWASGAFDPAAWTSGASNIANSWAAATLALRPA